MVIIKDNEMSIAVLKLKEVKQNIFHTLKTSAMYRLRLNVVDNMSTYEYMSISQV